MLQDCTDFIKPVSDVRIHCGRLTIDPLNFISLPAREVDRQDVASESEGFSRQHSRFMDPANDSKPIPQSQ